MGDMYEKTKEGRVDKLIDKKLDELEKAVDGDGDEREVLHEINRLIDLRNRI